MVLILEKTNTAVGLLTGTELNNSIKIKAIAIVLNNSYLLFDFFIYSTNRKTPTTVKN